MDTRDYPILYVDDDHANRVVMKHNLGSEFSLLLADSGAAALEILAHHPVAVLLADQRMPEMSGVDLAARARHLYPDVVRVIITAYSDLDATIDAINRAQVARFIKKPWTREELLAVMRESIQSHHNTRLIQRLQEKLFQLDRMTALAVMGSSIAHDLRQPMALIDPTLDVLQSDLAALQAIPLPDAARARVEEMAITLASLREPVNRLKLITDTVLDSLRGRAPTVEVLDLRHVVEAALSLMRGAVIARARLEVKLPGTAVKVRAAEGPLVQLVVNLVLNAVQALPECRSSMSQRISVRLRAADGRAVLEVEDTGRGIAPETLGRIFTPFFTTKGSQGTGLGLAICKQIVDDNHGTIEVQSVVGRGTTFTVMLPLL
jgi:signal transduction histidine kinase